MTLTHLFFMIIWALVFVFVPVLTGSADFIWYFVGTVMGAALMARFSVIEWRQS